MTQPIDMSFLPSEYKVPDNSNYLKLQDGETRFRILGSAIVGYEYWNTSNKPIRSKTQFKGVPHDIRLDDEGVPTKVKHFWAFPVWDYEYKVVKILEITQSGIQNQISAYIEDKDWGSPFGYDLKITRQGKGFDTKYTTIAAPHKPVDPEAVAALAAKPVNLDALFAGGNPFEPKAANVPEATTGSKEQIYALIDNLSAELVVGDAMYAQYVQDKTKLEMVPANYNEIMSRLKVLIMDRIAYAQGRKE